jgi:transporter family protein
MWKLYALLAAFFAALTAILAKVGVRGVSGNVATAVRTIVVLVMAWGIVFLGGQFREVRELNRTNLLMLCLSGVATGLSWIFYFKALETGNVSRVAPIDKLSVVLVMIFAFVFLGEQVTIKTVLGGLLITAGAVLLAL